MSPRANWEQKKGGDEIAVEGQVATGRIGDRADQPGIMHWQVDEQDCQTVDGNQECHEVMRPRTSDVGMESSGSFIVNVGEVELGVQVPNDPKSVVGVPRHDSATEDASDVAPGPDSNAWIEAREHVLEPGDRVTIAGRLTGAGDDLSMLKVEGVALLYAGSYDDLAKELSADTRRATPFIAGGNVGIVTGVWLFAIGRRDARKRAAVKLAAYREKVAAEEAAAAVAASAPDPEPATTDV